MKNSYIKRQRGMTLIELMVSMVVLTIMVSVAVPSMKKLLDRKSITEVGKFFERSIKLARTEAINRSSEVRIKSTSTSQDWSQGWFLEYTDTSDKVQVIRSFPALSGSPSFTTSTFDNNTIFTIEPNGQVTTTGFFKLFYPSDCTAGIVSYQALISGVLKKVITPCP